MEGMSTLTAAQYQSSFHAGASLYVNSYQTTFQRQAYAQQGQQMGVSQTQPVHTTPQQPTTPMLSPPEKMNTPNSSTPSSCPTPLPLYSPPTVSSHSVAPTIQHQPSLPTEAVSTPHTPVHQPSLPSSPPPTAPPQSLVLSLVI